MKAKSAERQLAEKLRRKGLSYKEIEAIVPVSRASLSLWLREIHLSVAQRKRLAQLSLVGQKAGAAARHSQRLTKLEELKKEVIKELPQLLLDEFFTLGLALYWAEGTKQKPWSLSQSASFGNSDPYAILIMRKWFQKYSGAADKDFVYRLHIHRTADIKKAKKEWSELLRVEMNRFQVTLKHNDSKFRYNKLVNYRGLINLKVYRSTWLNRRIDLWVKGTAEYFLAS